MMASAQPGADQATRKQGALRAARGMPAIVLSLVLSASAQTPYRVRDLGPGAASSHAYPIAALGKIAFFSATYTSGTSRLWKTDGTEEGTIELVAQVTGEGLVAGDTLYFLGERGKLWKSNGTVEGTVPLIDICPPCNGFIDRLTAVGGTLFFRARGIDGSTDSGNELWKTDGTDEGTILVRDICPGSCSGDPGSLVDAGGTLYFSADDGVHGRELWRSDGTREGTVQVADIRTGPASGLIAQYPEIQAMDGAVYFFAHGSGQVYGLYRSDGSEAGTDILPGQPTFESAYPSRLRVVKDTLYFKVGEAFDDPSRGGTLWKTDGIEAVSLDVHVDAMLEGTGDTFFFARWDAPHGGLWKTDGTHQGTARVKDLCSGACGGFPPIIEGYTHLAADGILYFAGNDGVHSRSFVHGFEPWRTDGTEEGTMLLADLRPGPDGSTGGPALVTRDRVYLGADDGTSGYELWAFQLPARPQRLLRNAYVTRLHPLTPPLADVLPLSPSRDLYLASFTSGELDPDPTVGSGSPLVFYGLEGPATLHLTKSSGGRVRIAFAVP